VVSWFKNVAFVDFYVKISSMKFLRTIILLIVLVSFMPLDGFCDDHHSGNGQEHHCVLACHTCHQMVSRDTQTAAFHPEQSASISFAYSFQYQAPVIEQTHRPPIASL